MKALVLAGAAAVAATFPASAQLITVGGTLAEACYRSAQARHAAADSLDICDRSLRDEPLTFEDRFATHVNRGIVRMHKGDHAGARSDFETGIAMLPNHPEPWLNMAILRFNQGDSAGSIPLFNRALSLGTRAPALAYYGRGLANEDRGDLKAAYDDLSRAASLEPGWDKPVAELARYRLRRR